MLDSQEAQEHHGIKCQVLIIHLKCPYLYFLQERNVPICIGCRKKVNIMIYYTFLAIQWNGDKSALKIELGIM